MARTPSRIPRTTRSAIIAGLAAFLLTVSSGAAWGFWTAQATATGTLTTAPVAVTQANFATPATTTYLPSALSSTRTFTITNTSAITGTATATVTSPEPYATNLTLRVWPVATAGACSPTPPGTGVTAGTWSSLTFTSAPLSAGASQVYCALTTISDWKTVTTATGGATVNPVLSVSLNAQGWIATTPTATHVQQTQGMYPLVTAPFFDPTLSSTWYTIRSTSNSNICLDVSGSGGAGTSALGWTCGTSANQRWQFLPVSGTDQSLVTIRPRHAPTTRLEETTTTPAGTVTIATAATTAPAQQWYVQGVSSSRYQLVSAATGKCLPLGSAQSSTGLSTVDCNSTQAQLSFVREGLTFSSGSFLFIFVYATVTFGGASFGTNSGQTGTLQHLSGSTWTTESTIAAGATDVSFTPPDNATTTYRIVFGTGTDVAYGNFTVTRNGRTMTATGTG